MLPQIPPVCYDASHNLRDGEYSNPNPPPIPVEKSPLVCLKPSQILKALDRPKRPLRILAKFSIPKFSEWQLFGKQPCVLFGWIRPQPVLDDVGVIFRPSLQRATASGRAILHRLRLDLAKKMRLRLVRGNISGFYTGLLGNNGTVMSQFFPIARADSEIRKVIFYRFFSSIKLG